MDRTIEITNIWIGSHKNIKELTNILGKNQFPSSLTNRTVKQYLSNYSLPPLCTLPQQPALMKGTRTITNYLLLHTNIHVYWPLPQRAFQRQLIVNNHPMSLLPVLLKLCKRVVHKQVDSYLIFKDQLATTQSGNNKHQSSTRAVNRIWGRRWYFESRWLHTSEGSGGSWHPQWGTGAEPHWGSRGKAPGSKMNLMFDIAKNWLSLSILNKFWIGQLIENSRQPLHPRKFWNLEPCKCHFQHFQEVFPTRKTITIESKLLLSLHLQ